MPDSRSSEWCVAERGHVTHARLDVGEGGRRQQRPTAAYSVPTVRQRSRSPQLRVIEDLVEMLDLCGGNSRRRQAAVEVGRRPAPVCEATIASHS